MSAISTNYRELQSEEIAEVAAECRDAWKHPAIPHRQFELVTKRELEQFRKGESVAPWDALIRCWQRIPLTASFNPTVLDVGASGGYYNEVLRIAGYSVDYTCVDFSEHFARLADELYPGIAYDVADACDLPFDADAFTTVIHSACIMHCLDYPKAIQEAARVAEHCVIFNKTPLAAQTTYFRKKAYGVPCLEIHFNEAEFLQLCRQSGLELIYTTECGESARSYVFKKGNNILD
jgi:Methylase involved in ubiquinone/menaquinone biosynthesis